jgi:hypothetical protein
MQGNKTKQQKKDDRQQQSNHNVLEPQQTGIKEWGGRLLNSGL